MAAQLETRSLRNDTTPRLILDVAISSQYQVFTLDASVCMELPSGHRASKHQFALLWVNVLASPCRIMMVQRLTPEGSITSTVIIVNSVSQRVTLRMDVGVESSVGRLVINRPGDFIELEQIFWVFVWKWSFFRRSVYVSTHLWRDVLPCLRTHNCTYMHGCKANLDPTGLCCSACFCVSKSRLNGWSLRPASLNKM